MNDPYFNEDFLHFESKVDQLMKLLEDMSNPSKGDDEEAAPAKKPEKRNIYDEIDENNIIVSIKTDRTVLNTEGKTEDSGDGGEMDKFTFMQQLEQDAEERAKARMEREHIAQDFRTMGNDAFRKNNYERAILLFTRGIEHIKDSPILYNNRALSYIKLQNYKRAIIDCDYVVNKLDNKNLRSWMYRAIAYQMLGDEKNFAISVDNARKGNPKKIDYINEFLEKIKAQGI